MPTSRLAAAGALQAALEDKVSFTTDPLTGVISLVVPGVEAIAISRTIGQTAIPMIVSSNGTIGNNGALSGIAALPTTYTYGCYMYFPLNAIYSGSLAGMYFVVMSNTTAGTIYNNVYTTGIPVIPATPTPFVCTGPGAFTTSAYAEVLRFTVPANTLGVNGRVEIKGRQSNSNSVNNKGMELKFGETGALTITNNSTTTSLGYEFLSSFANRGVTNSQVANTQSYGGLGATTGAASRGTVDTTLPQDIIFKLTNTANATDYVMLEHVSVYCIPS